MVRDIVVDLVGYDDAKSEIQLLQDGIRNKNRYIATQDSIIARYKSKTKGYENTIVRLEQINTTNNQTISLLQKQVKKSRRKMGTIGILSSIMFIGLAKLIIFN